MPLLRPEPPLTVVEVVQTTFAAFAGQGLFRSPALQAAAADRLTISEPHQVFTLTAADLIAGRGLAGAVPTGWRYLVQDGDQTLAAAEAISGAESGSHRFSHFNEGPFVASTVDAFRLVEDLPLVAALTFEVRLLHVPSAHTMAVWLHAATDDLVIPLAPSPIATPTGRPIPAEQLLEELVAEAQAVASAGSGDSAGG